MEGARDAGAPVSLLPWAADNRPSAGAFARALATICEEVPPAQLPVSPRMAVASREALAAVRASPLGPLTVFKPLSSGAALILATLVSGPEHCPIRLIYQPIGARKAAFPSALAVELARSARKDANSGKRKVSII